MSISYAVFCLKKKWSFDIAAGSEDLLARRVGRNELDAIPVCLAYFDAQNEYAAMTKVNNLAVYAQRVVSTPGTRNVFFLMMPPPPRSTLFPYTTLFRSERRRCTATDAARDPGGA